VLDVVVAAVQIVSLPVAALSIYLAHRSAKNAREIEMELHLADNFRSRWEASWRKALSEIEAGPAAMQLSGKQEEELVNMLNWLDWIGTLMRTGRVPVRMAAFSTLKPQLDRIVRTSQGMIEADVADEGREFWGGLLFLVRELNLEPGRAWADALGAR
jgi:hypothetical protein